MRLQLFCYDVNLDKTGQNNLLNMTAQQKTKEIASLIANVERKLSEIDNQLNPGTPY
jgi:hypothetical protein